MISYLSENHTGSIYSALERLDPNTKIAVGIAATVALVAGGVFLGNWNREEVAPLQEAEEQPLRIFHDGSDYFAALKSFRKNEIKPQKRHRNPETVVVSEVQDNELAKIFRTKEFKNRIKGLREENLSSVATINEATRVTFKFPSKEDPTDQHMIKHILKGSLIRTDIQSVVDGHIVELGRIYRLKPRFYFVACPIKDIGVLEKKCADLYKQIVACTDRTELLKLIATFRYYFTFLNPHLDGNRRLALKFEMDFYMMHGLERSEFFSLYNLEEKVVSHIDLQNFVDWYVSKT